MNKKMMKDLSLAVTDAEEYRNDERFLEVEELYKAWLGTEENDRPKLYPSGVASQLSEYDWSDTEQDSNRSILELVAVGILGLQRVYFVAAIKEFKKGKSVDQEKLEDIFSDYMAVFEILSLRERATQTIHGGFVNWVGEYFQDLVNYYSAIGDNQQALSIADNYIMELDEQVNQQIPMEQAGTLSSLAVLYVRRSRVSKSIDDILLGVSRFKDAQHIQKNPDRQKDLGKMILKDTAEDILQVSPAKTIRKAMLGIHLLIS